MHYDELLYNDGTKVKKSSDCEKILGVYIDKHLNFQKRVDEIVNKSKKRLYWLRVLKKNGINANMQPCASVLC